MNALERKRLLEKLSTDPGYLLLQQILQAQVDQLQNEILFTICSSLDMAITAEYKKGQLEGRLALEQLRVAAIDNLNIDIDRMKKNDTKSDDTDPGTPGNPNTAGLAP